MEHLRKDLSKVRGLDTFPGAVTILDVARNVGMGVGTVSRVLNGSRDVSAPTRERVLAAIRRMGFRPHAQARRITRARAGTVCFLLSNRDFLHPFHARILQGVETYASTLKQYVIFAALHYNAETLPEEIALPPVLQERALIDGLILAGTIYPNFIQRIRAMGVPFVAFSNNVIGLDGQRHFDQVGFDDAKGAFEATSHLVQLGHRHIAFVGDTGYPWFLRRLEGYRRALREAKARPVILTSPWSGLNVDYGERMAARLLGRKPHPTAVVAGNDEIAFGLWRALRRRGVEVPREMNIVGFDDREEALLMDPPLTTVRVHREDIGQTCMKMLLERLHHPAMASSERVLPTELIVRQSTGPLARHT